MEVPQEELAAAQAAGAEAATSFAAKKARMVAQAQQALAAVEGTVARLRRGARRPRTPPHARSWCAC